MNRHLMSPTRYLPILIIVACILGTVGCDATMDQFPTNQVYALVAAKHQSLDALPDADVAKVTSVVNELFGTPNEPLAPAALAGLVRIDHLRRAAGPVYSDQQDLHFGLYREHCATCHGLEGGGAGPAAALLNPYPRDFRHGVYKFKSTGRADKPTRDDLLLLLKRGIPGTAMPSFSNEDDEDLAAIVDYLIYLSIRGETERRLVEQVAREELNADELRSAALERVEEVATAWRQAPDRIVLVPETPSSVNETAWWVDPALVVRGKELFHGPLANCASCHGPGGDGTATTLDFDDWSKEYSTRLGIAPTDRAAFKPMKSAGALRPQPIVPRKLAWSIYHGSADDADLYRRLVTGIAGTPMPGLLLKSSASSVGVEPNDVWALVAYLRSLDQVGNAMHADGSPTQ